MAFLFRNLTCKDRVQSPIPTTSPSENVVAHLLTIHGKLVAARGALEAKLVIYFDNLSVVFRHFRESMWRSFSGSEPIVVMAFTSVTKQFRLFPGERTTNFIILNSKTSL